MKARPIVLTVSVVVLGVVLMRAPVWYADAVALLSALGLVSLSDDRRRAKANRIREALTLCGFTLTSAAQTANMDIADFSRMLSGERKLDDWRLEMLGDEFQRVLAMLTLRDLDLPALAKTALKIHPVMQSLKEIA